MDHPIDNDHINIVDAVDNYQEAIRLAARPLLKHGYIEQSYIDAMIGALKKYGPYIVIQDEFAMPHALPKHGVNKTGLSLLIVKNGVDVLGNSVKVFLVLAAKTKDALNETLERLSLFLMNRQNVKSLYNAKSIEAIQTFLQESW